MAGTDLTAVVVAAVGVTGTMVAPLLAQWARRQELAEAAERAELRLRQDRDEGDLQRRRDLYAVLNSAARAYRTAGYDLVLALKRGESVDGSALEVARSFYRDQYAQAQMVLPGRALNIASEVNRCLSLGYRLVRMLPAHAGHHDAWSRTETWFRTPLAEAVWLLRHALRQDLGVLDEFPDLLDLGEQLRAARKSVERELETGRDRSPSSGDHG
uniref:hypothetical protein n=1 Tax=Streptomyces sp. NBC_01001 TaxID=2903713 RepID=UPI002F90675F|nr:hypothetical protein OG296_38670 [Streptomyces sp. NBC_01001]